MRPVGPRHRSPRLRRTAVVISAAAVVAGVLTPIAADAAPGRPGPKPALVAKLAAGTASPTTGRSPYARRAQSVKRALGRAGSSSTVLVVHTDTAARVTSLAATAARDDLAVRRRLTRLHALSVRVPQARLKQAIAGLRAQPGVQGIEIAKSRHLLDVPDDPDFGEQAGYLNAIAAPSAWGVQHGSSIVKIAVVDSGVDTTHPDLAGKIAGTYNAVDGSSDVRDDLGHGTFVAGVAAAATDNGVGVAGAGYDSDLLAVKVADATGAIFDDAEAAGIQWAADHGARVINLSLGSDEASSIEQSAIDYAVDKGVLVVAAAGNSGGDGDPPIYPAAYPNVLAVGATDGPNRANFSEYGSWVDVAAPGVDIRSTTPQAGSTYFAGGYDTGSGTSFAAPLVAGEAALLTAQAPDASAADLRTAVVDSAHGYPGLGLGAGQVDLRSAFDHLRPATGSTLAAPTTGATVSGVVPVSATSTAATVRFQVDGGWLGNAVPVTESTASTTWTSWGVANGTHTIRAVDCSASGAECGTAGSSVTVTLANAAPRITSPVSGSIVSGAFTVAASAPGGGVAFYIDGVKRGFDASAPYTLAYSGSLLTDAVHRVNAVECSVSGTACTGPASPQATFTVRSLHPSIVSLTPNPLSPNHDGRNDTSTLTFTLPDPESVAVRVVNAAGSTVRGPVGLGTLGAGKHTWTWPGNANNGYRTADGTYTIVVSTAKFVSGVQRLGSVSRAVRVDTVAPGMTLITGSGAWIYPYPDGFRDTFAPTLRLSEGGVLSLTVRSGSGAIVRTISATKSAGPASLAWNGRNSANAIVPGGTYRWTFSVRDAAGNLRVSSNYPVTVSPRRLVTKTATISVHGAKAYTASGSDASCAGASTDASDFYPDGIWLVNTCSPTSGDIAAAFFHFTLPVAYQYKNLRLDTYGNTFYGPSRLRAAFLKTGTDDFDVTSGIGISSHADAWYSVGSAAAAGHYTTARVVDAGLFVTTETGDDSDFDVDYARLVVTYTVVQ